MKFILIFGPQAVGKMTVGQELAKKTNLKLFHNHMTIELLEPIFGFSPSLWKLSTLFRKEIFKTAAASNIYGLIFTYVWAFDQQEDWDFVNEICDIFESQKASLYFVELEAGTDTRLERNKSYNRLEHKPSKRNVEWSEKELQASMAQYRLNSHENEIEKENYLRIDNTDTSAEQVAAFIKDNFRL
ncbi:hypothetical protein NCCP2716_11440 [Sporosarcina sp. NCCP-2716]|uniref:AAA family ATPase n=1 Tax=Sporosarcina sp. NCCP-2716 TaxID=2943679 RepID=UPI002041CBFA|nr:AAA family ATPase [Sporosarcina sp. NCCP-2716]GKV68646.1 hypothetical protein NCCP2716_11440 [Sporosarcina sp. NCCP-2716]